MDLIEGLADKIVIGVFVLAVVLGVRSCQMRTQHLDSINREQTAHIYTALPAGKIARGETTPFLLNCPKNQWITYNRTTHVFGCVAR